MTEIKRYTFAVDEPGWLGNDPFGLAGQGVLSNSNILWQPHNTSTRSKVFFEIFGAQLDTNAPTLYVQGSVGGDYFTWLASFTLDTPGQFLSETKLIEVAAMPYYRFLMNDHATESAAFRIRSIS